VDGQSGLCPECWGKVSFITKPYCDITGTPLEGAYEDDAPATVLFEDDTRPAYRKSRSAFVYDEVSKSLLLRYKHADYTHLTPYFTMLLQRAAAEMLPYCDAICPVPLHPLRLVKRKYNQAALLSHRLAKEEGKRHWPDLLVRKRATPSQGKRTKIQRRENVKGAFQVNPRYKAQILGKNVLLVDDVMTTGATLEECTKVLLKAGARDVYLLTLGRVVL